MIETGIKGNQSTIVSQTNTAASYGSGELMVFATPAMIALMEETSFKSVAPYLDVGQGTVGTLINIKHVSATPVGMKVRCESELTEVDGRRLVFYLKAYDEKGLIGEGIHERFIINNEKFSAKVNQKNA